MFIICSLLFRILLNKLSSASSTRSARDVWSAAHSPERMPRGMTDSSRWRSSCHHYLNQVHYSVGDTIRQNIWHWPFETRPQQLLEHVQPRTDQRCYWWQFLSLISCVYSKIWRQLALASQSKICVKRLVSARSPSKYEYNNTNDSRWAFVFVDTMSIVCR